MLHWIVTDEIFAKLRTKRRCKYGEGNNMRTVTKTILLGVTLLGGASLVGFVSNVKAAEKSSEEKYAIMEKCEADARLASPDNASARYTSYAACMKKNDLPAW
jgi:hypothetical protein